ncbi:MAG: dihydrolipoamide dehydrogenase [Verrucomicrobiales bacterium]|nr:dihydrolipoamide dehydrogenase [Verrucomicrobiales bacterium]
MANQYDLVVIGAGPGGYTAAIRAAQLGLNVACVEKEQALGGTCLRIGCIPSKALLQSSQLFWEAKKNFAQHGIQCGDVKLDLATMLKRKESIVRTLTGGVDFLFKKNKVTKYLGTAQIVGKNRVNVQDRNGTVELQAKNILIATGSVPAPLAGVEVDGEVVTTSTEALSYSSVPKNFVVIGAGYIGLELGSVWNRLGAKVTVLEYLDRILPGLDSEMSAEAQKIFTAQGMEFRLKTKVLSAKRKGDQAIVQCEGAEPIIADKVLLAAGRRPNTQGLGLEKVGIELTKGFISVGSNFATGVPDIFAIGDVIYGPMLAHKAEEEAIACVEALVMGFGHVNYDAIPSVVYTHPQIASVGQTEDQLKAAGADYKKGVFPFKANARAMTLGATHGKVKVLADRKTDRVLGVHIIGEHADDIINEAAAAVAFCASSEDLARTCHAHPTLGEALKEAAMAVDNRAINM